MAAMKTRKYLIAVLSLLCIAAAMLAGCKIGSMSPEETKEKFNLTASVNYYGNGGTFQNNKSVLTVYYHDGDSIIDVGDGAQHAGTFLDSGTLSVKRSNSELGDWYYADLDSSGNPIFESAADEAIGKCKYDSDNKVEFPVTIHEGDTLHLVAGWQSKITARFILADAIGGKEAGTELYSTPFNTDGTVTIESQLFTALEADELAGNTYVACFTDAECKNPVTRLYANDYEEECTVYVKFLEGEWSVIQNGTDVVSMLRDGSKKYYFYQDVDCSALSGTWQLQWQQIQPFTGTLEGNGSTVSGLKISGTCTRTSYGLFGAIGATAKISDIIFEDLSLDLTAGLTRPDAIYALCSSMASGASLEKITITGTTSAAAKSYYRGPYPAGIVLGADIAITIE